MHTCVICENAGGQENARNQKGESVYVCKECDFCTCCEETMEDIDETTWVTTKRYAFPEGGWIFIPVQEYKNYLVEDENLRCNYCQSMQCEACDGFCQDPCTTCDAICSEPCDCVAPE